MSKLLGLLSPCAVMGFVTAANAAETQTYVYDALGRLVAVQSSGTINNGQVRSICFDAAGNRLIYNSAVTGAALNCAPAPSPTPTPTPAPTGAFEVYFAVNDLPGVNEGGTATFTVTRSNGIGVASVGYATGGGWGTAQPGGDYVPVSGTLVFQQGETQKTVQIFTINDTIGEPDEYFQLGLHSPSLGAVIMDSAGTVYIYDDDAGGGGGGVPTD